MASTLPNNPSLDRLRDDARRLQRRITVADRRALEFVRRHHPRPDLALRDAPERFALHDAQLTVARGYGFTGWPALVQYLRVAADLSVDPSRIDEAGLAPADLFCSLSSLHYDGSDAPPRRQAAADLLDADPGVVDAARVGRRISRRPGRAGRSPREPASPRDEGRWTLRLGAVAVSVLRASPDQPPPG